MKRLFLNLRSHWEDSQRTKRLARTATLFAVSALIAMPTMAQQPAATADDDGKVHFELMPYLVLAGMGGDITVKGRTSSFSQSAGDILKNLQFGVMGRTRVTYKRLFVGLDGIYMGLGAANDTVDAGVDQVIVEPSMGYKVASFLEVISGARYNSLAADLKFRGPLATQVYEQKTWWDPFVGGRVIIPFGKKYSFSARLDIGGFGAGSKVAVNAEPLFNMKVMKHMTLNAGWKFYYVDYKEESANFRYAALSQGPLIGATLHW
jgi:hypothetical protein